MRHRSLDLIAFSAIGLLVSSCGARAQESVSAQSTPKRPPTSTIQSSPTTVGALKIVATTVDGLIGERFGMDRQGLFEMSDRLRLDRIQRCLQVEGWKVTDLAMRGFQRRLTFAPSVIDSAVWNIEDRTGETDPLWTDTKFVTASKLCASAGSLTAEYDAVSKAVEPMDSWIAAQIEADPTYASAYKNAEACIAAARLPDGSTLADAASKLDVEIGDLVERGVAAGGVDAVRAELDKLTSVEKQLNDVRLPCESDLDGATRDLQSRLEAQYLGDHPDFGPAIVDQASRLVSVAQADVTG